LHDQLADRHELGVLGILGFEVRTPAVRHIAFQSRFAIDQGGNDLAVARLLSDRLGGGGIGAAPVLIAINKRDLPERASQDAVLALLPDSPVVEISSVTGTGIAALEDALARLLRGEAMGQARPAVITARQRAALERALGHVRAAHTARRDGYPIDLLATDVRAAFRALGEVTGEAVDEAVLAEIFSRFCIGK